MRTSGRFCQRLTGSCPPNRSQVSHAHMLTSNLSGRCEALGKEKCQIKLPLLMHRASLLSRSHDIIGGMTFDDLGKQSRSRPTKTTGGGQMNPPGYSLPLGKLLLPRTIRDREEQNTVPCVGSNTVEPSWFLPGRRCIYGVSCSTISVSSCHLQSATNAHFVSCGPYIQCSAPCTVEPPKVMYPPSNLVSLCI